MATRNPNDGSRSSDKLGDRIEKALEKQFDRQLEQDRRLSEAQKAFAIGTAASAFGRVTQAGGGGSIPGGIVSGALAGGALAGPIGAVAGGLVGGLLGGIESSLALKNEISGARANVFQNASPFDLQSQVIRRAQFADESTRNFQQDTSILKNLSQGRLGGNLSILSGRTDEELRAERDFNVRKVLGPQLSAIESAGQRTIEQFATQAQLTRKGPDPDALKAVFERNLAQAQVLNDVKGDVAFLQARAEGRLLSSPAAKRAIGTFK